MLALYLAALLAAFGAFGIQLFFGHHDAGAGAMTSRTTAITTRARGRSSPACGSGRSRSSPSVSSVSLLTLFELGGDGLDVDRRVGVRLAAGLFAAIVIRRLTEHGATSHAASRDVVGSVGRVVIPIDLGGPGKVRVEVKGSHVDYVARSRESLSIARRRDRRGVRGRRGRRVARAERAQARACLSARPR